MKIEPGSNTEIIWKGRSALFFQLFLLLTALFPPACTEDQGILPRLNTPEAVDSGITSTTATLKGEILYLGNMKIIEYGIELSKSMVFSPSVTKGYTTPADTGTFEVEFIDLDPNTLYYYKAYVLINTAYIYSQNVADFTTKK
jgi:hypothetical protein